VKNSSTKRVEKGKIPLHKTTGPKFVVVDTKGELESCEELG
jgi:hypothetical protein